ncbi:type I-E CRISPR-associated protein Cse2/CasB [Photobacterium sp. GB-210]|uniref:type I-E CRISPR-associated protein Cse2/CasB n=1 Tax=Photobacterium sp. GB-210 TaxID=2022104 RepID=UPI000D175BD2|nr:type I-E CRISPR-associated protein Cse2/CasB [Photobacterium sp. GB-210]PSV38090.1 type I-E CRISPR-associated protein Cse2/CasB [Photobacterium sp. GB-210]
MLSNTEEKVLRGWWQSLVLSDAELKEKHLLSAPSGHKAKLKRAESVDAVLMQDAFRTLWLNLPEQESRSANDMECWAVIAASLIHVSPGYQDGIATAAGKKTEKSDKSLVSEMRFSQLQAAKTPDELLRTLRRLLKLMKGKVDPLTLAKDIEQWFSEYHRSGLVRAKHRIGVKWAMDYYRAAK